MKKNIGTIDKAARVLVAIIILVLYLTQVISGTLAVMLLVLAGILVVTGLIGICPVYQLFSLSTVKKADSK